MIHAAGALLYVPDGRALFLRRSKASDHAGEWAFPGGGMEGNETPAEAAAREVLEETGITIDPKTLKELARRQADGVDYTTHFGRLEDDPEVVLNDEHSRYAWLDPKNAPENLHPGARAALDRVDADELGIARAMARGDLTSPQRYENVSLFALRISGTGVAYRKALKEFVHRNTETYLNDEFLARCNGLIVVMEHPPTNVLNSEEFGKRTIGSIMLPYLRDDEVWGIAKIYDDAAIKIMSDPDHPVSTSPAVVFRDPSVNRTMDLDDGDTVLFEGKPSLLDHLAICEQGVWDKGGRPTGVESETRGDSNMENETMDDRAKADAEAGEKLDKLLSGIDSLSKRMDAFEMKDDPKDEKKADEGLTEEEEGAAMNEGAEGAAETAADKAKKDAAKKAKVDSPETEAEEDEAIAKLAKAQKTEKADRARADADTAKKIADLERKLPKQLTDEDYHAMADAQARADHVASAFGRHAPRALQGEDLLAYRRRLANEYKAHSADYKDVDLATVTDPKLFDVVEKRIYADAMTSALHPVDLPEGTLREIHSTDVTGRRSTSFVGSGPSAWMSQFSSPRRRLVGINKGV